MEHLLAQCGFLETANYPLALSMVLGGLLGSISHCSVMCSPLVAAQMLDAGRDSAPRRAMLYYHMGRMSTYMLLGIVSVLFGRALFSGAFTGFSHLMLIIAGSIFVTSAVFPTKTHRCCSQPTQKLQRWIDQISWKRLHDYMRGALMGFMPCGMLLSALLLVSTVQHPLHAAFLMLAFGIATIPVLHAAGSIALSFGKRYPRIGYSLGRAAMVANGIFLWGIGLNLVRLT